MALPQVDQENLVAELLTGDARSLKNRLRRLDPRRRLVYFRNMQRNGHWQTRYLLPSLGYWVTFDEELSELEHERAHFRRARYRSIACRIEPCY